MEEAAMEAQLAIERQEAAAWGENDDAWDQNAPTKDVEDWTLQMKQTENSQQAIWQRHAIEKSGWEIYRPFDGLEWVSFNFASLFLRSYHVLMIAFSYSITKTIR